MPRATAVENTRTRSWRWSLLLVFALTFLAHARSLAHGFSGFDDPLFVTQTTGYRGLSPAHIAWDFTAVRGGHYQPLTYLSYGLDYALFGRRDGATPEGSLNPAAFHFTNILLHALNAVLVAMLARRLLLLAAASAARPPPAPAFLALAPAAAALFFGLHPLRVESVAWVTERRDVLSAFFLLAAALAYLRHAEAARAPAGAGRGAWSRWYWRALLLLLLSLLSKAWGMTFFVVVLILDVYPLARLPALPWRWRPAHLPVLLEKVPFAVLGLAAAAAAAYAQRQSANTVKTLEEWPLAHRLAQSAFGLVFYLWKSLWPAGLAPLYELRSDMHPGQPRFVAAAIALAALAAAVVALRRRAPALAAAAACYAVLVSPVLGLLQSGIQLAADRYTYLAGIPWAVLLGYGLARLASRRRALLAPAAAAALALGVLAWRQTGVWASDLLTFSRCLDAGWDGPLTRAFVGRALEKRGDAPAAEAHYRAGIADGDPGGECTFHLANLLRDRGDFSAAEAAYTAALAKKRDPHPVYLGLGLTYLRQERYPDAVAAFRGAVEALERPRRDPDPGMDGVAYLMLAGALDMNGELLASREPLVKALAYPLTRAEAQRLLAITDEELRAAGRR